MSQSPSTSNPAASPRASQTPATFHPWPRLPDELKLAILSHLLGYPHTIPIYRRTLTSPPPDSLFLHLYQPKPHLLPFIQTRNYQLVTLAQEVYYTQNTFSIRLAPNRAHICPWPRAGCVAARWMRRVHVSMVLDVNCTLDELVDEEEEGEGRWLFRRRRDHNDIEKAAVVGTVDDEISPAVSKAGFEKLDLLYVRITLHDEEEDEYVPLVLSEVRVGKLTGLMGEVELVLRAKEVLVSARVVSLDGERMYNGICGDLGERAMKRS